MFDTSRDNVPTNSAPTSSRRDQRLEIRKTLRIEATVSTQSGRSFRATTINISAHGVELISPVDLPPATMCELSFVSEAGLQPQRVTAHACVVRCGRAAGGYRLGLLLSASSPRANDILQCLVNC
jgi:hypothetical protein